MLKAPPLKSLGLYILVFQDRSERRAFYMLQKYVQKNMFKKIYSKKVKNKKKGQKYSMPYKKVWQVIHPISESSLFRGFPYSDLRYSDPHCTSHAHFFIFHLDLFRVYEKLMTFITYQHLLYSSNNFQDLFLSFHCSVLQIFVVDIFDFLSSSTFFQISNFLKFFL